jgi:hypothetical protein
MGSACWASDPIGEGRTRALGAENAHQAGPVRSEELDARVVAEPGPDAGPDRHADPVRRPRRPALIGPCQSVAGNQAIRQVNRRGRAI